MPFRRELVGPQARCALVQESHRKNRVFQKFFKYLPNTYSHESHLNFKCHVQSADSYICCARAQPLQRKTTTTNEPVQHIHILLLTTVTLTCLHAKRAPKHKIVLNATYMSLMAAHEFKMIFETKLTNLHLIHQNGSKRTTTNTQRHQPSMGVCAHLLRRNSQKIENSTHISQFVVIKSIITWQD